MRIAVVQFQITHLDRTKNLERIEAFVAQAKAREADVVVFPEDCMTGSIFGDLSRLDTTFAARDAFRALAAKYEIDIVSGSSMEGTVDGNFNTSYYVDARGEVLGTYRKNHLYPSENKFLKPGTEAVVFDTAYGRAGIVICWDMLFPEIFQRLKAQGVQIIYCPSYWYREIAEAATQRDPRSEEHLLDALCLTRAVEANAALVYVNAAGEQTYPNGSTDTLIGHSQIAMPLVGTLARLEHNREELIVHDLDLDVLTASAQIYQS